MYVLRGLTQHEPAPISTLVAVVQRQAGVDGFLPASQIPKLDDILVGSALMNFGRAEPPLVDFGYDPADLLPHGNVRPGAERLWNLTDADDVELERLERLAGVID